MGDESHGNVDRCSDDGLTSASISSEEPRNHGQVAFPGMARTMQIRDEIAVNAEGGSHGKIVLFAHPRVNDQEQEYSNMSGHADLIEYEGL